MFRGLLLALGLALLVLGRASILVNELLAPLPNDAERLLVEACIGSVPAMEESGWRFDGEAGFRELSARRILSDEATVVELCWRFPFWRTIRARPRGKFALCLIKYVC